LTLKRLAHLALGINVAGLLALGIMAGTIFSQLQGQQAALGDILAIKARAETFSVTSDELAISPASDERLQDYRAEARAIEQRLRQLGETDRVENVINALRRLSNSVMSVHNAQPVGPSGDSNADRIGPLALGSNQRQPLQRVANKGVELDRTLNAVIDKRRRDIASYVNQLALTFSIAVAGFALLGLVVVGLIYRRLKGPVEALEAIVDRVLAGDLAARAPINGRDEIAKLGVTFNAMLDRRDQQEAQLAAKTRALEEREAMLADSQRIANIGSWRYWPATGELEYSPQTFRILGLDPERDDLDTETFYARVHEADRGRVRAMDQTAVAGDGDHTIEYRVIPADGCVRHIHERAETRRDLESGGWLLAGTVQDITDAKAAEAERHRLRERLSAILESVTDAVISLDADWRFAYVNAEAGRLLDLSTQDNGNRTLWQAAPALTGNRVQGRLQHAMHQRETVVIEEHIEPLDRWLDIRAYPSHEGLTLLLRDTSEYYGMINRLMDQEARLTTAHDELKDTLRTRQALINSLPAYVALLDSEGNILAVNQQWRDFGDSGANTDPGASVGRNYIAVCETGRGEEDDEGASEVAEGLRAILRGDAEHFAREYPCHSPTEYQWFRVAANRVHTQASADDTAGLGAVVMHIDVTERKRAELALNRIAYEDTLTGAASRQGFIDAVGERLAASGWQPHARLVMLDLYHHHDINETYGFEAGDALLQEVTRRLVANTPDDAVIGRSGGDEFVVFLPARTASEADAACAGITTSFAEHFPVGDAQLERRASFGYTALGDTPRDAERLLCEAEMALFYASADRGADSWAVYTTDLDEQSRQRVQLTEELRQALAHDEFELHFQPKVSLRTGELVEAEALLRWWHPERGLQSPGLFIPIAEQSQRIGPLGDWVVDDACRRLHAWQDAGLALVRISVNVSVVQFEQGDFPQTVARALSDNGVCPSALTLEITESVFEQNAQSLKRQLYALHEMGVRLSLDDFGTGYSSLLYLQQYPFDEIKIDKGFVMKLRSELYNARVVTSVIGIAEALGAEVVAEGVESADIVDALVAMGCDVGQGFYYSMPLAPEDFSWLLEARQPLPLNPQTRATEGSQPGGGIP